jgi:hypothetical protein
MAYKAAVAGETAAVAGNATTTMPAAALGSDGESYSGNHYRNRNQPPHVCHITPPHNRERTSADWFI